jgi:hypothetical protein
MKPIPLLLIWPIGARIAGAANSAISAPSRNQ